MQHAAEHFEVDKKQIVSLVEKQRQFFSSGKTKPIEFRLAQFQALDAAIRKYEREILNALAKDLRKPPLEAYAGEVGFLLQEIKNMRKHLRKWAKPKRVKTPLVLFPSASYIYPEPYGVTLVIAPWNYPFQLALAPAIAAIAAGNCVVIKPSEFAPETSKILATVTQEAFDPEFVVTVQGGVETSKCLLDQQYDYIFVTSGPKVGQIAMAAASKHLTPVTLELGGKSPAIIDQSAPIEVTAKRIGYGKFFNAGQSCIAPDYLLVHESIKDPLIEKIKLYVQNSYGANPQLSSDYARIINDTHLERLVKLLEGTSVLFGGTHDRDERYIAPTLVEGVGLDHPIMQEEIFGPILPILTFADFESVFEIIAANPRPLALYLFSKDKKQQEEVIKRISFGGGCLNDTLIHFANEALPFGGVGTSGIGAYHGRHGFDTFSHRKSIIKSVFSFDPPVRYPPYKGKLAFFRRLLG